MPSNPTPDEGAVVPLEPTEAMVSAGSAAASQCGGWIGDGRLIRAYRAMLASRPAAPTQSATQTREVERLRAALERIQDWLRYEVPVGTRSATVMLTVVNNALSQPEPSQ